MRYSDNFFRNRDGIISIEFAACFCLFSLLVFIIYDTYSSIMLQNRLERANYTVASIFRERSAIYPVTNGSTVQDVAALCADPNSCFNSHELFDDTQVEELSQLASSLLNGRKVTLRVDSLFIFQDVTNPKSLAHAQLVNLSASSCSSGVCNDGGIGDYFTSLPSMTGDLDNSLTDYSKLVPYVERTADPITGLTGRWIPLYRVSMCIVNEESLYLKWFNSSRKATDTLPNLCSNIVVLSRCNDISSSDGNCPIYYR
ncbi:tight adherence pilus pseudopilin TadF [Gilliamella sp. BG2]|uniref:tight adherence pilus pseudopilin TadF n=1 Tax=Gilliamella sp. BG2 TaxID=3351509 RepID=UPI0039871D48